jgi:hypothetical protein
MFNIASWRPARLPGVGFRDVSVITLVVSYRNLRDGYTVAIDATVSLQA